jgi:hypothetical protein
MTPTDQGPPDVATRSEPEQATPPVASSRQGVPQNIVWIASYPKSGNTWIRVFVHNLLKELAGKSDEPHDINRLHEHTGWEFGAKPFERVLGKPFAQASHRELAEARPAAQSLLASSRPGPILVKTHLCLGHEFQVPTINIDVTLAVIYVVRNPLDVAISFSHHLNKPIDATIADLATHNFTIPSRRRHIYEPMGTWSQNVGSWVGLVSRPVLVMRYEDMLTNPTRVFGRLAKFLRLSPSEAQLKAAIEKSSFAELNRQEIERGFNERPPMAKMFFREGRAGQWREVLSKEQIQAVVRSHAPMMQRFGYLPPDCGASIALPPTG